jgi:DNA-binding transcriptional LysR family regulator
MAASFTIGEYLLPDRIVAWRTLHPEHPVRLDIGNSTDVAEAGRRVRRRRRLRRGARGARQPARAPLARRRAGHRRRARASAGSGAGRRCASSPPAAWVVRERGSGTREATDRWLAGRIRPMRIDLELGSSEAIKRVVGAGIGLGCLSRLAVAEALATAGSPRCAPRCRAAARALSIVVHRERRLGPGAEAFVAHCLEAVDRR